MLDVTVAAWVATAVFVLVATVVDDFVAVDAATVLVAVAVAVVDAEVDVGVAA